MFMKITLCAGMMYYSDRGFKLVALPHEIFVFSIHWIWTDELAGQQQLRQPRQKR